MSYLYLNFSKYLNSAKEYKENFYVSSLSEQYQLIKERIPNNKSKYADLDRFLKALFNIGINKEMYFYFTLPNFNRELVKNKANYIVYNNIVVRPSLDSINTNILPDHTNIIFIGDVCLNDYNIFDVKGIELIDDTMKAELDERLYCNVSLSFTPREWTSGSFDKYQNALTINFLNNLLVSCSTVKNPNEVTKLYEEYKSYLGFRNYYISELEKIWFKADNISYISSYALSKSDYRKNSDYYNEIILDGADAFRKGDMIIINKSDDYAELFPLIRLNFIKNKKEYEANRIEFKGNLVSEDELRLKKLTRDNCKITIMEPNRENAKNSSYNSYILGDRFKFISTEIEPLDHLQQLDNEYSLKINSAKENVKAIYKKKIKDELNESCKHFDENLDNDLSLKLDSYEKELLEKKLDKEEFVKNEYNKEKDRILKETRSLKKNKKESNNAFEKRKKDFQRVSLSKIDLDKLCETKIKNLLNEKRSQLEETAKKTKKQYSDDKLKELENNYQVDIERESKEKAIELKLELENKKQEAIENETLIQFSYYFKVNSMDGVATEKEIEIINECQYITFDSRAETAKVKRQERALDNFYNGNVKNPYLSTYLFDPESLSKEVKYDDDNWTWYLDSLNEKQKEAVRRAVSSNGIFLLQGPPGTGKTQVIAETVAHLVKNGKKVLISSETHKAIDNVFDRLPKIPEIIPVRLIPSFNKKENLYDPKRLVDNLYLNISNSMNKSIDRYNSFSKNMTEFEEKFKELKLIKANLDESNKIYLDSKAKLKELDNKKSLIKNNISNLKEERKKITYNIDKYKQTDKNIKNNRLVSFDEDDVNLYILSKYKEELEKLFDYDFYATKDYVNILETLTNLTPSDIDKELEFFNPEDELIKIKEQIVSLKSVRASLEDDLGEVLPGNEEEHDEIKKKLVFLINKRQDLTKSNKDIKLNITKIFKNDFIKENKDSLVSIVNNLNLKIKQLKDRFSEAIELTINDENSKVRDYDLKISENNSKLDDICSESKTILESEEYKNIIDEKANLYQSINNFFKEFEIVAKDINGVEDALLIIQSEWLNLKNNFKAKELENKEKIPMYKKITKYILQESVIEEDRFRYSQKLFNKANVFGITCTSNDRFSENSIESLRQYNLGEFDLKDVGIDVVIIDEVSKSNFLDLLIPILYGKTIILVGDHRQLPPMYDLAKLNKEDLDAFDQTKINMIQNEKYTTLMETCFFKELFEKVPDQYKIMLLQQYRCHEQIMEVFNIFYDGKLKLGYAGQNIGKAHNINISLNGSSIIEQDKHVYFVNCNTHETRDDLSTSIYNLGEVEVTVKLIKLINDYFINHSDLDKLSIGVICTYGDQANRIKRELKSPKLNNLKGFKTGDEKLIVSTVDDFQGDERDIIILSTVRNPEKPNKSNPGFINAYQRVNVSLSRARKLLIVVGNKDYLINKGVIDKLPSIDGNPCNDEVNFRIYSEIIKQIDNYGKILEDTTILNGGNNK